MKLLIVEDDRDVLEFIREGFKSLSFAVDIATDGKTGSYEARTNSYDMIILDYSLPFKNGIEVCQEIRAAGGMVPIIFLSAVDDPHKKIEALSKGADDYLAKPFLFEELRERVNALFRRPRKLEQTIINIGEVSIDMSRQTVSRTGKLVYLTRKEYSLLEYLARNPNKPISRSMILEHVWNSESDPLSNTVESHILRLRKKLHASGNTIIKNIPGRGYIIEL